MGLTQKSEAKVFGIIPARWSSSRFPGKPLHLIAQKELVLHVWDQCQKCQKLDDVIIATDDMRIYDRVISYGAKAIMTRTDHETGTDRIAEVLNSHSNFSHVINIQGDEPLISPDLIDELADELRKDASLEMVTAATPITDRPLIDDPNVVKVVVNQQGNAMYFSRSPIPFPRNADETSPYLKHIGIYGYQSKFIREFIKFQLSKLEKIESLEQLRALDQGATIRVVMTEDPARGVDTPEQADIVEKIIIHGQQ